MNKCILAVGCNGSGKETWIKDYDYVSSFFNFMHELETNYYGNLDIVVGGNLLTTIDLAPYYAVANFEQYDVELLIFYIDPREAVKISGEDLNKTIKVCEKIEDLIYQIPLQWEMKKTFIKHKSYVKLDDGPMGRKIFT